MARRVLNSHSVVAGAAVASVGASLSPADESALKSLPEQLEASKMASIAKSRAAMPSCY
ncbi:hypothetical protein N9P45_00630 [bacterium]|nr:hypothetical protein [bacterium]